MKKKGFTLVELLAVIAILAILIIIALPNVIGLFKDSQKNSFINETRDVYRFAEQTWMSSSILTRQAVTYGSSGTGCTVLDMNGRTDFQFKVTVSAEGKVTSIETCDGANSFTKTTGITGIESITGDANQGYTASTTCSLSCS